MKTHHHMYKHIILFLIITLYLIIACHRSQNQKPSTSQFLRKEIHQHLNSSIRHVEQITNETSDRHQNDSNDSTPRPIMHTFFEPIKTKNGHRGIGMSTPEGHMELLKAWKEAWQEAGWDTRVLTLKDAMAFPDYNEIRESLDRGIFGEYDTLCFLRWFAMVSVGGGWMSDYDVFPLKENIPLSIMGMVDKTNSRYSLFSSRKINPDKWKNNGGIPLPNNGKFTAFDNGGITPSLVSGSKKEWDRISRGLIEKELHHLDGFYSDMLALDDYLDEHPNIVVKEYSVAWSLANVMYGIGLVDCTKVWGKQNKYWAVHFSHWNVHDGVNKGVLREDLGRDDRPQIATDFMRDWKEQCSTGTKCFDGSTTTCY